ncbi:MAG: hypothetical protein K1X68_00770 [Saprospiraceae bacterium]|nr:hypothetical protein [Saprospiraceae bacterium]HMW40600.1 hypothetical protein [Saprospiraceae bacterium]HMX89018.1 hypothetical protein [Saprospiraceae bacterium]HMZ40086.1 hypothetical protein [Saprospiraceae bacterium]HNA65399.1 hypothetical protein [Saprospiraceae bacterium]
MWTWKERHQIHDEEWNAYLSASLNPCIEYLSWYLDTCAVNWGCFVHQKKSMRLPVAWTKKAGLIPAVTRPPYLQKIRIIGNELPDVEDTLTLYQCIRQHFRCGTLDWEYHLPDSRIRMNYILERSHYRLNQSHTRHLKKSMQNPLTYRMSEDPEELLYWLDHNGERYVYEKDFRNDKFRSLVRTLLKHQQAFVLFAVNAMDEIQSAGIFTRGFGRLLFFLSFTTAAGRKNGSMVGILNHVVHEIMQPGEILDLEGSDIPGVALFYEGFNAQKEPYFELQWSRHLLCKVAEFVKRMR